MQIVFLINRLVDKTSEICENSCNKFFFNQLIN